MLPLAVTGMAHTYLELTISFTFGIKFWAKNKKFATLLEVKEKLLVLQYSSGTRGVLAGATAPLSKASSPCARGTFHLLSEEIWQKDVYTKNYIF